MMLDRVGRGVLSDTTYRGGGGQLDRGEYHGVVVKA